MMIDPPIDKMIEKTGCRYVLTCAIAQRARILSSEAEADYLKESGMSPISLAAKEIYDDKVRITNN